MTKQYGQFEQINGCVANDLQKQVDEQQQEMDGLEKLIVRQSAILDAVANALKGEPKELSLHSHHDLGEVARNVVNERERLRSCSLYWHDEHDKVLAQRNEPVA